MDSSVFRAGELVAGRYEVISLEGTGGMGSVYRARDNELGELVALKVLHRDLVGSPEMLARFRREAKLARRVTHKNVARTYDIGEHGSDRFLTMELVEGEPLRDILAREGRLDLGRALELAAQMADGLAAAHEAGVVHRDLKPENVLVAAGERAVLTDFGISRTSAPGDTMLTTGAAMGTPAYMAPEQVEGVVDVDARTDVYAFGTVIFEMLTGRVAWTSTSPYLVATARLTSPPPDPRADRPEISSALAAFVMRCMARDREARFVDGRALARALRELIAAEPTGVATEAGSFGPRLGADALREDLPRQLVLMSDGSPVYRRVLQELQTLIEPGAGDAMWAAFDRIWQKRSFDGPFERPLLILAALREDARAEGATHPLYAALAASPPDAGAVTPSALRAALGKERLGFWIALRTRRVQTNEGTRSLAWLWPATIAGAAGRARPIELFDVGASAGLNLTADALDVGWERATGGPITIARDLDVRRRIGFDPRPLDARTAEDCNWLRSCIWPEQTDRLARLEEAITAFRQAAPPAELQLMRASSVPAQLDRLTTRAPGSLAIAYQTLVRSYIPAEERAAYEAGMQAWLAAGERGARVWSVLELEEVTKPETSCALDVHVSTGDGGVDMIRLGRMSYHPRTVEVAHGAEACLSALMRQG